MTKGIKRNKEPESITNRLKCDHEADPATIEYDKRTGRRAKCRKCGADLVMTLYYLKPGHESPEQSKPLTSAERRALKRRRFENVEIEKSAALGPSVAANPGPIDPETLPGTFEGVGE